MRFSRFRRSKSVVGSSRSSTRGLVANTLVSATSCFSPPESENTLWSCLSSIPRCAKSSWALCSRCLRVRVGFRRRLSSISSRTVGIISCAVGSEKIIPTCCRALCGWASASTPLTSTVPSEGCTSPLKRPRNVDFPLPLSPNTAVRGASRRTVTESRIRWFPPSGRSTVTVTWCVRR